MIVRFNIALWVILAMLGGCVPAADKGIGAAGVVAEQAQDMFLKRLMGLCGKAFSGRLVSQDSADADMVGKAMIMHVRDCSDGVIRIPFHIGPASGALKNADEWNRSRTWVIARKRGGLQLKHDHRHKDGSADAVTFYGGDTTDSGSAARQSFAVDAESIAMFQREGLTKSVTNIWTIEVDASVFAYELRRTGEHTRFFRVEFDLTKPVPTPPAPWGF
jgi:hypothetical protein